MLLGCCHSRLTIVKAKEAVASEVLSCTDKAWETFLFLSQGHTYTLQQFVTS